jgi:lipopolysaccharide export system protein LptA
MKSRLLIFLAMLTSFIGCYVPIDESSAIMVIDKHTTQVQLNTMIADLAKQNIAVTIDDATYRENGGLQSISGKVQFEDGEVTFNSDKVSKIIVRKDTHHAEGSFGVVVRNRLF